MHMVLFGSTVRHIPGGQSHFGGLLPWLRLIARVKDYSVDSTVRMQTIAEVAPASMDFSMPNKSEKNIGKIPPQKCNCPPRYCWLHSQH